MEILLIVQVLRRLCSVAPVDQIADMRAEMLSTLKEALMLKNIIMKSPRASMN
jgi:hypothetical protein